jgi:drug/metabolite transporter (DMT)-like permease
MPMQRVANWLWSSPWCLLLVTGSLLGASLPLGKIAAQAGIEPVLWALVVSAGVVLGLAIPLVTFGQARLPNAHRLRYFFVTATISYALPNVLLFTAIPHVGAGYAGIMFALSPIITLFFSLFIMRAQPSRIAVFGLCVGFAGAIIVAWTRGPLGQPAALVAVLLALLIPVCLAVGNVYRTIDWPPGAGAIELAVGSHAAACLLLFIYAALTADIASSASTAFSVLADVTALQMAAAAAMFAVYFRLQAVGGPVYLSQIGYVAAAVGLISGTLAFGERYAVSTWAGAALIVVGVATTSWAQSKRALPIDDASR